MKTETKTNPELRAENEILKTRLLDAEEALRVHLDKKSGMKALEACKAAEAELRSSALFPKENPFPVLRVARDGTLLYANRSSGNLLASWGCKTGEIVPKRVRDLVVQTLDQGLGNEFETSCESVRYSFFVAPIPSAGYANLYGSDITERKRVEQTLQKERAVLDGILKATDVMLVYLDPDFNLVTVNPAYAETCKMLPEEMIGKNHFALYPNEENETIFRRVRDTGEAVFYKDKPFKFPDQPERGVTYWDWSLVPVKDAAGQVVGLVFTLRETTKQKQAEEALRESLARYRTLFTNMTEGFALGSIIRDAAGIPCDFCLLEVNDAFEQQTGLTREILGQPMTEVLPNLERYWIETYCDVALTGRPVRFSNYNKDTGRHYDVFCYSPVQGRFAILFRDITKQKQDEDALRQVLAEAEEGKRTLDALMEYVPDGITIADSPDLNVRMVSRYGQNLLGGRHQGMTVGEVAKQWQVYDQDGLTPIPESDLPLVRAIRKGETVRDKELVQINAQGRKLTLLCNAAPIRSGTGHITGGIVAWRDITEMRKTRDALRDSERLYRAIGESIDYGVWVCDPEGRNTYASESFLKLVGITQEQCSNFGWGDVLHPDDAARTIVAWKECVRTGGNWDIEHRFRGVDGQWHSILARGVPVKNEKGEILFWAGINLDISRLKSVQEALRKSESQFRLLSNTAGRLMATENPQGIVNELCRDVMAHLDCHAFFNFLVDEKAGRLNLNACAGIPEEETRKIEWLDYGVAVCGCAARDAKRIVVEDILHTSDPRTDLVKSFGIQAFACHPLIAQSRLIGTLAFGTKSRIRFSDQDLALMKTVADQVAMAMDRITLIEGLRRSRDELEIRVKERTAELARSNRELQDFASIASHDLQEPLRKVQAFGNLLFERHGDALNDEGRDYLTRMKSAAARMQGLIGSLLDYSRVTSRAKPFSEVDLGEAAKEALFNLEIRIKETGGRVEVNGLPLIRGDKSQIVQLFQNLIGNGLKFHKEGDRPHVKVYAVPGKGTKAGESDFWDITVEDNGIGFDEARIDRIFEPFQRLHGRSSPYSGTGMGLAICRKIVERHGGTIGARSTPGEGSAFVVTLPKK